MLEQSQAVRLLKNWDPFYTSTGSGLFPGFLGMQSEKMKHFPTWLLLLPASPSLGLRPTARPETLQLPKSAHQLRLSQYALLFTVLCTQNPGTEGGHEPREDFFFFSS